MAFDGLSSLGAQGAMSAASALSQPAENYTNDSGLELQWAMKAYHHAETYFNLISSVDPARLRLSKHDDEIYKEFRKDFKDLKIDVINIQDLKTDDSKSKWRPFCNHFEGQVDDFNFGTLLRIDCSKEYSEENSLLVTRIQFYAIEIARNREGYNACIWNKTSLKEKKTNTKEGQS
ncbi:protein PBDC1-like [Saccoglossus kowalevskii]|uniref:Protein PBDC1-like n=1 Tax=Saccoglossus kowalevskii TaxID=10224 RepID=A0ABM0GXS1_SACKO|nr:PREDICTED: protein PBDC1-like [Saccoglossus kowalevskii]